MRTKKSQITSNTIVVVVVAVLCLILLVIVGVKIYSFFMKGNFEESAKDNLDKIAVKIDYLVGGSYSLNYLDMFIHPPKSGWYLRSFLFATNAGDIPKGECVGKYKSCLCMCSSPDCQDLKSCRGFERGVGVDAQHKIPRLGGASPYAAEDSEVEIIPNTLKLNGATIDLRIEKSEDNKIIKIRQIFDEGKKDE